MPRPSHVNPDNILRLLQVTTTPLTGQEIAQRLHLRKIDRRPLFKMLGKLKKRGAVEEISGNRYQLAGGNKKRQEDSREPQEQQLSRPTQQNRDEVKGRLVLHQDGYGFVVPATPIPGMDGDIFIPRGGIEDAMHGDHVLVRIQRSSRPGQPGRGGGRRVEGHIVRVLDRAHPSVVGVFHYGSRANFVVPYDTRMQQHIEVPSGEELSPALREKLAQSSGKDLKGRRLPQLPELDGAVVNVEVLRYPRGGLPATGRVIEILGRPGDLGVDTEIIIRKHHLPHTFSAEVLQEAEKLAQPVTAADHLGREDFRHLPIVTIDGETARDFDDAVYVERRTDGGWMLQVHIADVAHYVRPDSALDQEARLRGTSVYFIDRAVPMLPEALSNGMCSLKPREDRLVMSAILQLDASGRVQSSRMTAGVIRSAERMTYTNVNKVLEGDPEMTERYATLAPRFADMKELALLLNARRNEAGSIDFDLPEPLIEFDAEQKMVSIGRSERNIAHRLIEEFMLAANRAVDSYLSKRGIPALHRVHEKPDAKKVLEFEDLARAFGYTLGVENLHQREVPVRHGRAAAPAKHGKPDSYGHGRERGMRISLPGSEELRITPQHYQRLLRKLAGKPEERIVSYLMLRSLKQARYSADPLGHFALGFDEYTHFTSPIRRYPDLIVHRILKWALEHPRESAPAGRSVIESEAAAYSYSHLSEFAAETSDAERRANQAERELVEWKTAQFMEEHLGEEYSGLIISVQKYGCFVELLEIFVEGLLPLAALEEAANARCVYREFDHSIVALAENEGRRRAKKFAPMTWKLGDRIRVRAERIDPMRHRVEFALVTPVN